MEFLDERFWLAISFIIFIYFAYKPIKTAILNSLDAKIAAIRAYLLETENLKKEAELLLNKTEEEVAKLADLRQKILTSAEANAKELIDQRSKEIEKLLERKKSEALNSLQEEKVQNLKQVQIELAGTVTKLVANYFKASNNDSQSDTEIAQKIKGKKK